MIEIMLFTRCESAKDPASNLHTPKKVSTVFEYKCVNKMIFDHPPENVKQKKDDRLKWRPENAKIMQDLTSTVNLMSKTGTIAARNQFLSRTDLQLKTTAPA